MKNLSFNDGKESFKINNDPNRVIRFNPADPEIINRILGVQKDFQNYTLDESIELNPDGNPKSGLEKEGAYVAEFTKTMRKIFNDIFNSDVYDIIFDGQSPFCIVGQKYLFEEVLDGLINIMQPAIDKYTKENDKKMRVYLKDVE